MGNALFGNSEGEFAAENNGEALEQIEYGSSKDRKQVVGHKGSWIGL